VIRQLLERHHQKDDAVSSALFSRCEGYRYALTREWGDGPRLLYIMLNPSKATEAHNDPTVERCERRARALGFGGFRVCNLFAWRETDPKALRRATVPEGPCNAAILSASCDWADTVLCGWGAHGAFLAKGPKVAADLRVAGFSLYHLGLTKDGHPRHPLYVAYRQQPVKWEANL
jgi:hypothetical protein